MGSKQFSDRNESAVLAELDQLTAGLARSEPAAVQRARECLMHLALDATPNLLRWVFDAIAAEWEVPVGR